MGWEIRTPRRCLMGTEAKVIPFFACDPGNVEDRRKHTDGQ